MTLIMVVDDDQDLAEMLAIVLTGEGMEVDLVARGDQVIEVFRNSQPDLVLLDLMLPGLNGIEVCKLIRAESMAPIVMLTAKGETSDVVKGLEAGADDYIVKPFQTNELLARVKARLRRTTAPVVASSKLEFGGVSIDLVAHEVRRGDKVIALTRLEFDLLLALAREPGRVFTREALLGEVWGYRHSSDTRLVNVHIQRIRSKIERDPNQPELVLTVRGVGYRAGNFTEQK
jgi:two-component system, OmpR family, response regulator MtrA